MTIRVLVASNSHKDIAASPKICEWIAVGIGSVLSEADIRILPIADGGDGTIDAVLYSRKGWIRQCVVHNPLFETRTARYGVLDDAAHTAIIEIAEASGSAILETGRRDTIIATSYGTGELIRCALQQGTHRIIAGLGGSIVSDGGMGMAQALGVRFHGEGGVPLVPVRNSGFNSLSLPKIESVDLSGRIQGLESVSVLVAADVETRLLGPDGQARTFGPQKGATPSQIEFIENGLTNWARVLEQTFNRNFDVKYAGAAGGLGSGLSAFLGGKLQSGAEVILEEIGFQEKLESADVLVTGEGRFDETSLHGKAPAVVAERAKLAGKQVVGLFGVCVNNLATDTGIFDWIITGVESPERQHVPSFEECRESVITYGKQAGAWIRRKI